MHFFEAILWPFKLALSWVLVGIHSALVAIGFNKGPGIAWILSIVVLTIIVRIILIPLFFKQIKANRAMQILQPELKKLQKKYKNRKDAASREKMRKEQMELYKKNGTNPMSSCMPVLFQLPVFFALYAVLNSTIILAKGSYYGSKTLGALTVQYANEINKSKIFGASLADTFMHTHETNVKIVAIILIIIMALTQFFTMKQLTLKNMPASVINDPDNPALKTNKMMMYVMPLIMAITGVNFQIGVLIYWLTTNIWTMGQQFYSIEKMPVPGSEAEKKLMKKRAEKGLLDTEEEILQPKKQRPQPVSKKRQKAGVKNPDLLNKKEEQDNSDTQTEQTKQKLSKEEIARRRYEKRAAERKAAAKKRNKKK